MNPTGKHVAYHKEWTQLKTLNALRTFISLISNFKYYNQ